MIRGVKFPVGLVSAFFFGVLVSGCAYNPLIDREQLIFIPESQMATLSASSWSDIQEKLPESQDSSEKQRAQRVATRLLSAMGEQPADWDVRVFEDEALNAFALPGGRIGITSAMMSFCRSDDELAAVIGHEIAHVELRHSAERMSQDMAARGVTELVFQEESKVRSLLGIGAVLGVILPYSRRHELEADRLGVRYLHGAGYNPQAAISLWTRMSASRSGPQTPDWLSTHPADSSRIDALRREVERIERGEST